jgi:hypothetical protein
MKESIRGELVRNFWQNGKICPYIERESVDPGPGSEAKFILSRPVGYGERTAFGAGRRRCFGFRTDRGLGGETAPSGPDRERFSLFDGTDYP